MKGNKATLIMLALGISIFAASCADDADMKPEDAIPKAEFIEILADIQIFESMYKVRSDRKREGFKIEEAYQWLFDKHQIDQHVFKESFDYYSKDPMVFEAIYDEVIIRISEKEVEDKIKK